MDILRNDLLGEEVKVFEINGLKVHVVEKKGFSDISASLVVKYGANDISFKLKGESDFTRYPLGIAHFLEHKLFDGEGEDKAFKRFSDIGAKVNAYTSNDITNYYFNTSSNFEKALEYLCDMIYNFGLNEESVQKEKPIIEQELTMYRDDPYTRVYRNLVETFYSKHPVRFDIGGDVESINAIKREHLLDCYNKFYSNENMFMVLVGNVDAENCKEILSKFVKKRSTPSIVREKFDALDKVSEHYIEQDMKMNIPTNLVGFKDMNLDVSFIRRCVVFDLVNILFFRSTSDFYEKIYKEGIITGNYLSNYRCEKDYSYLLFGEDGDSFKKFPKILIDYYRNYDFSKDREAFVRVKKSFYGKYVRMFNSISNISQLMIKMIRNDCNLFDYLDCLDTITFDEVVFSLKNILDESNMVYSRIV